MYKFYLLEEHEFGKFTDEAENGNYLQTKEMASLKKSRGAEVFFPGVKDESDNTVMSALMTKTKLGVGFVFDIDGLEIPKNNTALLSYFLENLKEYVKKEGCLYLTISPNCAYGMYDYYGKLLNDKDKSVIQQFSKEGYIHEGFTSGYATDGNPQWIYKKSLEGFTEPELLKSYGKDAKYSLNKAKSFGITTKELRYEELPQFKEITERTSIRRNFKDKSLDYYQAVYKAYGDRAKFVVAEINFRTYLESLVQQKEQLQKKLDEVAAFLAINPNSRKKNNQKREFSDELSTYEKRIEEGKKMLETHGDEVALACALFLSCPHETVYLFSGTEEEFKKLYAPFLIQDKMLRYSVEKNIPLYNFYGIEGIFDGSDGILKFKQSFNGYAEEKIGTFKTIINPGKYKAYMILKHVREFVNKLRGRG
ncbi:aminoacyltransferase [Enterococcus sp. BWT-B8]|uniref:aminoacyltransferase n=1 Tax=Enterococcus sp. BWT-B8 TaxID=2885157 RepID=UPI001E379522|nr:aminoacyltransferase [Enterococcus sp. BWT-B8]MCB5950806.1 aminoacyltransferase [Enterococcus sp. BWT-B8]